MILMLILLLLACSQCHPFSLLAEPGSLDSFEAIQGTAALLIKFCPSSCINGEQ